MSAIQAATTSEVTREQIRLYAEAVGDFNPMHLDDEFAKKAGLPSVIAHGPLTVALVIDVLVAQLGVSALRGFEARLRAPVFPGDRLEVVQTENGIEARKSDGTVVISATVDVEES
jgi:acyl dehydratase